ncbi:MAG: hypothetical protein ABTR07_09015 [Candidatus Competibacter denitrificans]
MASLLEGIELIRGDSFEWAFEIVAQDQQGVETAVDITGWRVASTVKRNENDLDADALVQAHVICTAGQDSASGKFSIFIPPESTDKLTVLDPKDRKEQIYYDLQYSYTDTLGCHVVKTFDRGYKRIVPDATRTTFL